MPDSRQAVFECIRAMFAAHAARCLVTADNATDYFLATREVRAKDGYRTQLGGVALKKNYVSTHLMPVYVHPELLNEISPALRKRMQGNSCFNFKTPDDALFAELEALIARGVEVFAREGRL